jgi:hypothetical protein
MKVKVGLLFNKFDADLIILQLTLLAIAVITVASALPKPYRPAIYYQPGTAGYYPSSTAGHGPTGTANYYSTGTGSYNYYFPGYYPTGTAGYWYSAGTGDYPNPTGTASYATGTSFYNPPSRPTPTDVHYAVILYEQPDCGVEPVSGVDYTPNFVQWTLSNLSSLQLGGYYSASSISWFRTDSNFYYADDCYIDMGYCEGYQVCNPVAHSLPAFQYQNQCWNESYTSGRLSLVC